MNSEDNPITEWLEQLRAEDASAAAGLWRHFASQLHEAARKKLRPATRALYDEEDAAQSAFNSVCARIAAGHFQELTDRSSLLRLLLVITARKIARRHQFDQRDRRDLRRNLSNQNCHHERGEPGDEGVQQLPSREPTPEFAAEFLETFELLFQSLDDPRTREVVTMRMAGYTDSEVAQHLSCSRRTVQRTLEVVRRRWIRLESGDE